VFYKYFLCMLLKYAVIISGYMDMNGRIINEWWIINDFEGSSYALTKPPLWHLPGGTEENWKKLQDSWYRKLDSSQASSNASFIVKCYTTWLSVKFFIQGLIHTDCHDRGCILYHIKLYFLKYYILSLCRFLVMGVSGNIRPYHWTRFSVNWIQITFL
jgi:hypothetical protein